MRELRARAGGLRLLGCLAFRTLLGLVERRLHNGEIGEDEIGRDALELVCRLGVAAEATHDDGEGVGFAELRDPLRRGRPARDVDEPHLRLHGLPRALHLRQDAEARIGHRHDRLVRLTAVRTGPRDRREQRRFPAERHPDEADVLHAGQCTGDDFRPMRWCDPPVDTHHEELVIGPSLALNEGEQR